MRLPALDGLRGLLAALVVAAQGRLTALGSAAVGLAAEVAVAVFFVLFGLVLTRAWNGRLSLPAGPYGLAGVCVLPGGRGAAGGARPPGRSS